MTLQLRSISVYSHEGERRDVHFKLGSLNIVTGASKTGKSALLDIVDYCWGRDECTVAEGEIRKAVSWFAVHLDKDGEGVLVARKNPGPSARASAEIYFDRGVEILPADTSGFNKNITSESLKAQLSAILGISENLHIPGDGATRPPLEASSRHAILFCLQAQDEIANRRLLFHRQGEQFLPQATRDVLPYFLGAVDEGHLYALRRYQDVRLRLRKMEREAEEAQSVAQSASSGAQRLLGEAQRVGLIPSDRQAADARGVLALLAKAVTTKPIEFSTVDDPEIDLTALEEDRRTLQERIRDIREEIAEVERLNRESSQFEFEAGEQEARLSSIGLIHVANEHAGERCPLCENELSVPVPAASEVQAALTKVQFQLHSVRRDAPRLQGRLARLASLRDDLHEQLKDVQSEIASRITDNERLRLEQHQFVEQARVAGRIAYYVENVELVSAESELSGSIDQLRAELAELEVVLDRDTAEARLTTALNLAGRDLTRFAMALKLEHSENLLRIDPKKLTVVADTDDGPLPLSQMGSGENWVGYHVAAHLSLHSHFRRHDRPVPSLLMLDQLSQAHYPPEQEHDVQMDDIADEDKEAVRQLFLLLHSFCDDFEPRMQIIVIDHVELLDGWFKDSIIERWRDGSALIPQSWLEAE